MSAAHIARGATRSMRIIALPLTPHCNLKGKPIEHLTYYHFVTSADGKKSSSWLNWAVAKASDLWAGLGKAEEGTWKVRVLAVSIAFPYTPVWMYSLEARLACYRAAGSVRSVCGGRGLRRTLVASCKRKEVIPAGGYYARTQCPA